MKNVWIFNHYGGAMYKSRGGRHYAIAKYLKIYGYSPVVFVSNSKHGVLEKYNEFNGLWTVCIAEDIDVPFVFVKSRLYSTNGKQRVYNMIDFFRNVKKAAKEYAQVYGVPDVIYASSVHPLTLIAGIQIAKYYKIPCVSEVRDLWPESIVQYSSKYSSKNFLIQLLYQGEKWIYKKSNAIIFTMEGGRKYIEDKRWNSKIHGSIDLKKTFYVNNGVDLEIFDRNCQEFMYMDAELDDSSKFKVVYTGAIRHINNLGMIVDVAKIFEDTNIIFLIWGTGDELESLKERVNREGINNVYFKGYVEKMYIPSIVCKADLNIVHWKMSSVLRYGVSYNKLFEYLAAGKPIVSTVKPGYSLINRYACGEEVEEISVEGIANSILKIKNLPFDKICKMGENARKTGEEFDYRILTQKIIDILESLRS
jgi:glycosyltransferase involved in cell wall biosynthesis